MEKQSCLRDFEVLSKLGQGAFGQVFKVKRKADGKQYALKKVKMGVLKQKQRENALNEIRILASYDGEYIIGYKQAFYDEISGTLCVVMQFASGGDVLKKVQNHIKNKTRINQQQVWKALIHMTKGLKSLHDKKILHRDLKCANVFITGDGIYKLGDLNVSKVLKKQMAQTQTGTPYYASPQVWKDKPYGQKSDLWSLGCVLYQMAALKPPFTAYDLQGLYKKVCNGVFQRIPMTYSNQLANLISSLLKVQPSKRPTAQQLLNNPLIQKRCNNEKISNDQQNGTGCDELLKTIKYNPRDLKGLKNILPKSNYQNIQEQQKIKLQPIKQIINSQKINKKQSDTKNDINIINQKKLKDFIQKRKAIQDKQREKQVQILKDQKQQLNKKRQRVLSACGVRHPVFVCDSPRVAVHNKKDSFTANKQGAANNPKNLLPKVPKPPISQSQNNGAAQVNNNNINYKLPPRPNTRASVPDNGKVNQSYDHLHSSRQKSIEKVNLDKDKSKQKLQKAGQRIVLRQLPRSSSQHKIVYPSWWG